MPGYEAALIFRVLERPELTKAIKRCADLILDNNGVVRSFEFLGQRQLPYRMFSHGVRHSEGSYFIISFDSQTTFLPLLRDHCMRDADVVRPRFLRREEEAGRPCDTAPCEFGELNEELRNKLKINLKQFIKKM